MRLAHISLTFFLTFSLISLAAASALFGAIDLLLSIAGVTDVLAAVFPVAGVILAIVSTVYELLANSGNN